MPGRPPKSHLQLVNEKKSHRTKDELETRKKAEAALLTGTPLREWPDVRANPVAHKEFARLRKLLRAIQKDDALQEGVFNRYCLLLAECKELETMRAGILDNIKDLAKMHEAGEIETLPYLEERGRQQGFYMALDKKIMDKRTMMLAIEKENIMTIASVLRSIPKKPDEGAGKSKMAMFLERRQGMPSGT